MTYFIIIALLVPDLSWGRPAGEKYLRPPHQENLSLTYDHHGQLLELTANFIGGEPGKIFLVDLIGDFQSFVQKIEANDRAEDRKIIWDYWNKKVISLNKWLKSIPFDKANEKKQTLALMNLLIPKPVMSDLYELGINNYNFYTYITYSVMELLKTIPLQEPEKTEILTVFTTADLSTVSAGIKMGNYLLLFDYSEKEILALNLADYTIDKRTGRYRRSKNRADAEDPLEILIYNEKTAESLYYQSLGEIYNYLGDHYKNIADGIGNLSTLNIGLSYKREALKWQREAIKLNPDYPYTYCSIAQTFASLGWTEKAIEYFEQAISKMKEKKNRDNRIYIEFGNFYFDLARFDEAGEYYRKALKMEPDNYAIYNYLGQAFAAAGDYDAAFENFNESLEKSKGFFNAENNRSRLRKTLKSIKEKENELGNLSKPDLVQDYFQLSEYYYRINDFRKTLNYLQRALKLVKPFGSVSEVDCYYNIARIQAKLHNYPQAINALKQIPDTASPNILLKVNYEISALELESRYLEKMKMGAGKNDLYGGLAFLIHPAKIFLDQLTSLLSPADFKLRSLTHFTYYINRQTNQTKIALRSL